MTSAVSKLQGSFIKAEKQTKRKNERNSNTYRTLFPHTVDPKVSDINKNKSVSRRTYPSIMETNECC